MQVFRLLCSAAPDTLCELLTVCAICSVSRVELIRFVCCIDNVQQSFRIRVNIVTIAGEATDRRGAPPVRAPLRTKFFLI